jgi:tetratricopeptide (TPR) repeat protein
MGSEADEEIKKVLDLAKEMADLHTGDGIDKAAEILMHSIAAGCQNPAVLITAAAYLLQGSQRNELETRKKAVEMVERALSLSTEDIHLLESALHSYEILQNAFPEKLREIIRLAHKLVNVDPEHVEAMVILATHKENPDVALSLGDAIRMMEWAQEIAPSNNIVAFTLSKLYYEAGYYRKARILHKRVVENSRPDSDANLKETQQDWAARVKSQKKDRPKFGRN